MSERYKFSVIIPTMWCSDLILKLLDSLNDSPFVGEIILIDNDKSKRPPQITSTSKLRIIEQEQNIYVNPAWNLGVKIAKNDSIALINDDINFNPNIFEVINSEVLDMFGIIGMGEGNYKYEIDETNGPYIDRWKPGINDGGWGCFIMFDKKNWINIPDNIKIWYGDNIIKDINPAPKGILRNFKIETEMSTTSDEPIWDDRKKEDYKNFINYLRDGEVTN
jgi:glycosyltransferase involved in cell wall biosynthesis